LIIFAATPEIEKMLEIPESYSFARQAADMLSGRTVTDVFNATHPHKFTWYLGDPADYRARLVGKTVSCRRRARSIHRPASGR